MKQKFYGVEFSTGGVMPVLKVSDFQIKAVQTFFVSAVVMLFLVNLVVTQVSMYSLQLWPSLPTSPLKFCFSYYGCFQNS